VLLPAFPNRPPKGREARAGTAPAVRPYPRWHRRRVDELALMVGDRAHTPDGVTALSPGLGKRDYPGTFSPNVFNPNGAAAFRKRVVKGLVNGQ
jgi:hypothetical protein